MPFMTPIVFLIAMLLSTVRAQLDWKNSTAIVESAKPFADTLVNGYYEATPPGEPVGLFWSDPASTGPDHQIIWSQSAVIWDTLVIYANLTGDSEYNDKVAAALYAQVGETEDFMPNNQTSIKPIDLFGNQNQSQWALAALSAAEFGSPKPIDGKPTFFELAQNVFDSQAARWDNKTCGGGLREAIVASKANNATGNFNRKTAASNSNFFLLAARLHRFTANQTYADWAESSFAWAQEVGMVSSSWSMKESYQVIENKCKGLTSEEDIGLSSSFGNFLEGATIMAQVVYDTTGEFGTWHSRMQGLSDTIETFRTDQKYNQTINNPCPRSDLSGLDCGAIRTAQYAHSLSRTSYFGTDGIGGAMIDYIPNYLRWSADQAVALCSPVSTTVTFADGSAKTVDLKTYCDGGWGTNLTKFQVGDVRNAAAALEVLQGNLWTMKNQSTASATSAAPTPTATDKKAGAEILKGGSSAMAIVAFVFAATLVL